MRLIHLASLAGVAGLTLNLNACAARQAGRTADEHAGHAPHAPDVEMEHGPEERVSHNRHLLISADWLRQHPDSAVLIHVGRTDSSFRANHIPGSRFLPITAVARTVGGLTNEFPPVEEMVATFRMLGVGDSGRIVIYGEDAGLLAARAWVALDLMGHGDRAALLDGGVTAWQAAGGLMEAGAAVTAPRQFTARWQADRLVSASWVRANLGRAEVLFIDARPADQFAGAEPPCPPAQPACAQIPAARRGHIPGASNLYWMDAFTSPERPVLKSMHMLHHQLWEAAGADRPEVRTVVTYCRSGMQASHAYWQARYIGYPDVRLYDGSFLEWSALAAAEHPVASPGR